MPTLTTNITASAQGDEKNLSFWAPESISMGVHPSGVTETFGTIQGWYNNGNVPVTVTVEATIQENATLNYFRFSNDSNTIEIAPGDSEQAQVQYTVADVPIGQTVPVAIELTTTYEEVV